MNRIKYCPIQKIQRKRGLNSREAGFSLVEILIALPIFIILTGSVAVIFMTGVNNWQNFNSSATAQREVRKTLNLMARDLREAKNINLTQSENDILLFFTHSGAGTVSYLWSTSGPNANQVLRTTSQGTRIISNRISTLSVTDDAEIITIDVAAQGGEAGQAVSYELAKKINKREGS